MRAPKAGDLVKIEIEATVYETVYEDSPANAVVWFNDGPHSTRCVVRAERCEIIVPPMTVGDLVHGDNIGQLPAWSIVAKDYPFVRVSDGRWWIRDRPVSDNDVYGATVLRIGPRS